MEKAALKGMFASGNIPAGTEYKAALTDILQAFPYFQLAQVFFAKQMYDTHEPDASGRIKLASVYAPDRKAMYLLFKAAIESNQAEKPVNINRDKIITSSEDKGKVKYNYVYTSTTEKDGDVKQVLPKSEEKTPVTEKKEAIPTETFIKKELEARVPVDIAPLKLGKTTESKTETKKPPSPKVESPVIEKITDTPISTSITKPVTIPLKDNKIEALPNEPISDSGLKYSFSSWLKVIPEISLEKKEPAKPSNQKEAANIIDTFLKKMPSISRPKAEFFSSVKAAKMSITEDDTIISETLANIYFTQGNLPRALKAYQTLLLQFPEKSNIFAARIEEIKTLIRENTKNRN